MFCGSKTRGRHPPRCASVSPTEDGVQEAEPQWAPPPSATPPPPSDPSWKHEEKCPLRREWGMPGKAPWVPVWGSAPGPRVQAWPARRLTEVPQGAGKSHPLSQWGPARPPAQCCPPNGPRLTSKGAAEPPRLKQRPCAVYASEFWGVSPAAIANW